MPIFVHLAPESRIKAIKRNGIAKTRRPKPLLNGVFAMPVTENFYYSHQWLRELKRKGQGPISGVYFRIPDKEKVSIGLYNKPHLEMTAAEAVGAIMHCENAHGYEVIIPRKIESREIHATRQLPQIVGWRYFPGAHGRKPCGCSYCQRGLFGGRKIRDKYEADFSDK